MLSNRNILWVTYESRAPQVLKNLPAYAGDTGHPVFDPWVGKIPWRQATSYGVAKSQTRLSDWALI